MRKPTQRRARRDTEKPSSAKDRRKVVLENSLRLFLRNGFQGTSVQEIGRAAGVGTGTIYWHFRSKDEILETILSDFETSLLEGLHETVDLSGPNFESRYEAFVSYMGSLARDDLDLLLAYSVLFSEVAGTGMEAERIAKRIYHRFRSFVEASVQDGKEEGAVAPETDCGRCASLICIGCLGMLMHRLLNGHFPVIADLPAAFLDLSIRASSESQDVGSRGGLLVVPGGQAKKRSRTQGPRPKSRAAPDGG